MRDNCLIVSVYYLHVLYGCHSSPGTHLVSRKPASIGSSLDDWEVGPPIAPSISYPTFYRVTGNKELVYFRTKGHISSWTYKISDDRGKTWVGPKNDVTDLDSKGRFEWSSYQCKLPSKDGRYLHVVFTAYDDNRDRDSARYYNPRYRKNVSNEWKKTVIATSNHQWNSCHVNLDREGIYHAYLVTTGETYIDTEWVEGRATGSNFKKGNVNYLNTGGYMDKHGGGRIQEWISADKGSTWQLKRDLTPDSTLYPDWSFNNVQPVTNAYGRVVEGMLMFYGWKDPEAPAAKAFLFHEGTSER